MATGQRGNNNPPNSSQLYPENSSGEGSPTIIGKRLETSVPRNENILVEWESGDKDPLNPRSLPTLKKWLYVLIVSIGSMLM
jgi:hypothetical protein